MGLCLLKEGHISDTLLHGMCKPHCGNLLCYAFCYEPHYQNGGSTYPGALFQYFSMTVFFLSNKLEV